MKMLVKIIKIHSIDLERALDDADAKRTKYNDGIKKKMEKVNKKIEEKKKELETMDSSEDEREDEKDGDFQWSKRDHLQFDIEDLERELDEYKNDLSYWDNYGFGDRQKIEAYEYHKEQTEDKLYEIGPEYRKELQDQEFIINTAKLRKYELMEELAKIL